MNNGYDKLRSLNLNKTQIVIDKDKKPLGFYDFNKYCDSFHRTPTLTHFDKLTTQTKNEHNLDCITQDEVL